MTAEQHNLARILALRDEFRRRDTHCVAITIARGCSRRLPRKNVRMFCGRPLVEWSILMAKCSHLVTHNYLSTDDEEIADIGRAAGASIIWRYEAAGAGSTGMVPFSHAIRQIREHHPVDIALTILPTNPVRLPWDFDEPIRLYWELRRRHHDLGAVGVLAAKLETIVHRQIDDHTSRVVLGDKGGRYLDGAAGAWRVCDPDWYIRMAQVMPTTDAEIDKNFVNYAENHLVEQAALSYFYKLEPWQCFDIDTEVDWGTQEALMMKHVLTTPDVYERYKTKGEA